ncbi:hypothetical protein GGX14DRAFT_134014 [Mycena pura]|uniref:Uncharacterized protein n=1 Tax=Mycena pura TaxID=153505 RepID=A0AAD6Y8W5_9AGAR|nr:hypothetical protein GGX14DRAFT_134014 [Mycena pura]
MGTVGPFAHSSHDHFTCDWVVAFTFIFSTIGISMADMILMVRTYTLYERSRKLLAFLFVFWSCLSGIAFWAATKWGISSAPPSPFGACYLSNPRRIGVGLVCYFVLLVGETTLVLLTAWKVFRRFSHQKITTFWRSMYCDGLWIYLAILPFTIATVICLYAAPPGLSELFDTYVIPEWSLRLQTCSPCLCRPVQVMHSILCCRLVTHARDVAAEEDRWEDAINKVV